MEEVALDSLGPGLEAESKRSPASSCSPTQQIVPVIRALALWGLSVWQSSSLLLSSVLLGNLLWAPVFIFFIQT